MLLHFTKSAQNIKEYNK